MRRKACFQSIYVYVPLFCSHLRYILTRMSFLWKHKSSDLISQSFFLSSKNFSLPLFAFIAKKVWKVVKNIENSWNNSLYLYVRYSGSRVQFQSESIVLWGQRVKPWYTTAFLHFLLKNLKQEIICPNYNWYGWKERSLSFPNLFSFLLSLW